MIMAEQIMIQKTSSDIEITKWVMNVMVEHELRTSI